MGELWVMFYFGDYWGPPFAIRSLARRILVHSTKWNGPNLVEPTDKPWDQNAAHKPWLVKHDGVVYHFYCACGDKGRVIALATSKEFPPPHVSQAYSARLHRRGQSGGRRSLGAAGRDDQHGRRSRR